jgi:hypothetical protein
MAQQEWILGNFREYYDRWEDDDQITGEKLQYRQYRYSVERFAKYVPPFTLTLFTIDYSGSPSEVDVNACGQSVDVQDLRTSNEEEYGEIRLMDRTLQYNQGESGILLVSESWESDGYGVEYWSATDGQWKPVVSEA